MSKILFFDGICVMCNSLVDFVLRHDKDKNIMFAPLQGLSAQQKIPQFAGDLHSVVFINEQKIHTKSDAILNLFSELGGIYRIVARVSYFFPQGFRDWIYDLVAKNRYRLFAKKEQCRMPSVEERQRFLE